MKKCDNWVLSIFVIGLLVIWGCGKKDRAGNTMETENSIAVQVWQSPGDHAASALVRIRPIWYVAADTIDSLQWADSTSLFRNLQTDSKGKLVIENLPEGSYVFEFLQDSLGAFFEYYHVPQLQGGTVQANLAHIGSMQGQVPLPQGASWAKVQIFGTDYSVRTDSLGKFSFDQLPPGVMRIIAWLPENNGVIAEDLVLIRSSALTNANQLAPPNSGVDDPATWKYMRSIQVSTLVSDWMKPLQQEAAPYVISLRLQQDSIFTQARADGADLRITDAQGNTIQHELAHWDNKEQVGIIRLLLQNIQDTSATWILRWGREKVYIPNASIWDNVSDSLFLELNSVLLDDFETVDFLNKFKEPANRGFWYLVQSPTAQVNTPEDWVFTDAFVPADSGRDGTAITISYNAPAPAWILFGSVIADTPKSLASLDSVVYWIRGDGEHRFAFDHLIDSTHGTKAWAKYDLTPEWTKITVTPNDFLPPDNGSDNIGWEAIQYTITNISFFGNDGTQFWLDDIRLYGINWDDL
jgi:hypothetical protein